MALPSANIVKTLLALHGDGIIGDYHVGGTVCRKLPSRTSMLSRVREALEAPRCAAIRRQIGVRSSERRIRRLSLGGSGPSSTVVQSASGMRLMCLCTISSL